MSVKRRNSRATPEKWTVGDLGVFYAQHRQELISHAFNVLKDSGRADEVVQDVFIKMIMASPELKSPEHARAYLHRAIQNHCMDLFRLEGRRPALVLVDNFSHDSDFFSTQTDLSDSVMEAEDAALVRQALSHLSHAERAALVMWEVEGRSTSEIALELGIRERAVRHTVARARTSLRRVLTTWVIDENNGLTALDLLSKTYKKAQVVTRKSSGIALSILFLLFAFLGLNSLPRNSSELISQQEEFFSTNRLVTSDRPIISDSSKGIASTTPQEAQKSQLTISKVKEKFGQNFPGVNSKGVPTGFTITDFSGIIGDAYFREQNSLDEVSGSSSQIIKTKSGAANILLVQGLSVDESGVLYQPMVSYGRDGEWIPLLVSSSTSNLARQVGGRYLLTVNIQVESEADSVIKVASSAGGRDLYEPPRQIVTRILLDASKLRVLAQAVLVLENGTEA